MYKGRLFNREQLYICGDFLEGDIYPVFQPAGKRRKRCKPTSAIQKRLNQINRERELTRVIRANYVEGDYVLSPTWAQEPDRKRALKDLRNYILWMQRKYKKASVAFKYILTIEYGKTTGRINAHLIVPQGVDRDAVEDYWRARHGVCNSDRLTFAESGGEALAKYICKPGKVSPDGTERFFKSWSGSRNLVRPEPSQIDGQISMDELDALGDAVDAGTAYLELERRFPGYELVKAVTYRNEINRGVYVHFEMRRKRGRRPSGAVPWTGGTGIDMASDFSYNLRRLRERRGLSARTLSELCGLSKNSISRYERGEQKPTAGALEAIADYFSISVDELLKKEEKKL